MARSKRSALVRTVVGPLALLAAGVGLVACTPSGIASKPLSPAQILRSDSLSETVHLTLDAGVGNYFGNFNFDGYGGGAMRVVIPFGWTVDVDCENVSSEMAHSCAIVDDAQLSVQGGTIAFPGASVPDPVVGLQFRERAEFSFVADRVGTFRIDCLIPGHEADGMWDWLTVVRGGRPKVSV